MRRQFVTATIMAALACGAIAPTASSENVSLSANSQSLQLSGTSGGPRNSKDCGFVPAAPSQVITVSGGDLNRIRLEVNATGGQPTLLVNGPTGRFCTLASGNTLQMAGVWQQGRYEVSVGDRAGESHSYTLSVMRR